jgi:hypothetical protein
VDKRRKGGKPPAGGSGGGGAEPVPMQTDEKGEDAEVQRALLAQYGGGGGGGAAAAGGGGDADLEKALLESYKDAGGPGASSGAGGGSGSNEPANPHKDKRDPNLPVGLKNNGNACYFNSIIQAFFFLRPTLVEAVLTAKVPPAPPAPAKDSKTDKKNDKPTGSSTPAAGQASGAASPSAVSAVDEKKSEDDRSSLAVHFLRELQKTFAFLHLSKRRYYNPQDCVNALFAFAGKSRAGAQKQQQDVHEYAAIIQEAIEEGFIAVATGQGQGQAQGGTPAGTGAGAGGGVPMSPSSAAAAAAGSELIKHMFVGKARIEIDHTADSKGPAPGKPNPQHVEELHERAVCTDPLSTGTRAAAARDVVCLI